MSRNQAFNNLLALGLTLIPPGGTAPTDWGDSDRKWKDYTKVKLPALWQIELDTEYTSRLGQLAKREQQVWWSIVHNVGKDQAKVPAEATADFLDRAEALLCNPIHRQSLGGLVYAAFIQGTVRRFPGDGDGIEILQVPITVLFP
jgi:hypothetical protein